MNNFKKTFLFILTMIISPSFVSISQSAPKIEKFDHDKNELLDPIEYSEFFLALGIDNCKQHFSTVFDASSELKFRPEQLEIIKNCAIGGGEDALADFLADVGRIVDPTQGIDTEILKGHFDSPKPRSIFAFEEKTEQSITTYGGLLVRKKHEDIFIWTPQKSFQKAESASVSYSHDFTTDNDLYSIQGALLYPIRKIYNVSPNANGSDELLLGAFSLTPSIELNFKDDTAGIQKEVNSLAFRFGTEFEFVGGLFDAQFFRFKGVYNTDTHFRSAIGAFEAEWSPVRIDWGLGAANERNLGGLLGYQLRATAHLEGGEVFSSGGHSNLKSTQFLRFGPDLRLDIWPLLGGGAERVTGHVNYVHYESIAGGAGTTSFFEAGADFRLDEIGHFKIGAKYRNGRIPLVRDRVEDVTVSFDVKF